MERRILAASLVISLAQINLAHAQTADVVSRGKIEESVGREIKKQTLLNYSAPAAQSAWLAASPDDTAPAASQLMGPFIRTRGSFKQHVFATIGAVAGLFGGGYLGVKIEGDRCHCDDPGLAGFLIGAPIGAIVGGIAGYNLGK